MVDLLIGSHQHSKDYGSDKMDLCPYWFRLSGNADILEQKESKDPSSFDCHLYLDVEFVPGMTLENFVS